LVKEFDSSSWKTPENFYDVIASDLKFPDYFGRNLDALNDCFSGIEIPLEDGFVIAFSKFDLFNAQLPDFTWNILDIISKRSRQHLLFGKRLICLIQSDDPQISFKEVGKQPVIWNPRERPKKNRGL
jgi:RNAse (barnase) inhibitor barstar